MIQTDNILIQGQMNTSEIIQKQINESEIRAK